MYGKTDYSKMRGRFQERVKNKADADGWWKPEQGKNRIRVCPPPAPTKGTKIPMDAFMFEYGVHYQIGDDNEVITCPRLTLKKPCPICEFVKGLWKGSEADKKLARGIGAKLRTAMNIVLLSEPGKVYIWSAGKMVRDQLDELVFASDPPIEIDDPDQGYNMVVTVSSRTTPDGVFPQYIVTPEMKPCALPDKKVLEKLSNIAELICGRVKSYDELRSILLGKPEEGTHETKTNQAQDTVVESVHPAAAETTPDEEIIEEVEDPEPTAAQEPPKSSSDVIALAKAALAKRHAKG